MTQPNESVVHGSKASPQDLPSVDRLLRSPAIATLIAEHGHTLVAAQCKAMLDQLRAKILSEEAVPQAQVQSAALEARLKAAVRHELRPRMQRVFNLTGTVIHTNLGRAVLPEAALQHIQLVMSAPNNLEYDLATGGRGDRDSIVEELICQITGAEAATVVNNNAAAVLLSIAALARDREVIVSRGEQVEIGGAFRMPDVMASAGAKMVEVGTTNRTHAHDYERAINERTALIMKVHTSNYAVQGFTSAVDEKTLAQIAHSKGVLLCSDLGSGSLVDLAQYGLPHEPLPQQKLADGCDVVTFSGDKLLGGPQAGIIVGKKEVIHRIRKFPMKRALRTSKLPLAALEVTLRLYLQPDMLKTHLPTLRMLTRSLQNIQQTAAQIKPHLDEALHPHYQTRLVEMLGQIGSGSLPIDRLKSAGIAITPLEKKRSGYALNKLSEAFRALPIPVIGRIVEDQLLLDLRCLENPQEFIEQLPQLKTMLATT